MPDHDEHTPPGPFAAAAFTYHRNGWAVLPLPAKKKAPVPEGWTGSRGATPSGADIHAWVEERGHGNIALRLPPHILGIDVDHYDGKPGGLVLDQLQADHGPLPPTWRTTSRDDGVSGIRLYRIPVGLRWPGGLGPGIDTIRFDHRYALTWPSVHPGGGTYRWVTPEGATALDAIPHPDDLPDLPDAWVAHFTGGETSTDQPHAGLDRRAAGDWIAGRGAGTICRHTQHALDRGLTDLATTHAGGRHDAALRLTNRLAWIAADGHTGTAPALEQARAAFLAAVGADRDPREAADEWDRMVTGGIDIAAGRGLPPGLPDPCTDPFHGLIDRSSATATPAPGAPVAPPASAPSGAPTGTVNDETPEAAEDARTTWWPRDLDAALDDDTPPEQPAQLARTDGHPAFYPGRVNGIIGPSESGKTWVALHAVQQAVQRGEHVTVIDFEDSDRGITARLVAIGLTCKQIRRCIAYINPDEPFHPFSATGLDLAEHLDAWQPTLVVVDGFNAAMTLQGLDLKDNKDATTFMQHVLKPIARRGPAVVYIDHTPKDREHGTNGGIGAQAKRAMTTGCTLRAEPVTPFGKGQSGKIRLHVDKDRLGSVRGVSAPGKAGHWFGDLTIVSSADGADVDLELTGPTTYDVDTHQSKAFRPTVYMARVCAWLADNPGAGFKEIVRGVTGDEKHIKTAIRVLVDEGWVGTAREGQKHLHTVLKPYFDGAEELLGTPSENRGWTGGGPGVAPPADQPGVGGGDRGDVVPRSTTPGEAPSTTPSTKGSTPTPGSARIVHRSVAGKATLVDLDTGELIDPATGEVVQR